VACSKAWIDKFNLHEKPSFKKNPDNANRYLARSKFSWRLYDLRHAYAIRLNLKGVPPTLAAQLMGHTLQVHCATYQKWIAAKTVTTAMKQYDL
jgi:integrase